MSTIQLGTVTFQDFATAGWVFEKVTDWFGQVDDRSPVTDRPTTHGAFPVVGTLRSTRAISFTAHFLGVDDSDVEAAVDELSAVGAEGPVLMRYTTPRGSTWRIVSVITSAPDDWQGDSAVTVAVDVIARDPRRYADGSDVLSGPPTAGVGLVWPVVWPAVWPGGGSSGRVELVNTGTAPSSPVFRLAGGFDTALITCVEDGSLIGFDQPVIPGSVVEIDVAERRAVLNGQSDVSRWLRFRQWVDVPGGASRSFQFDVTGANGSPTLTGRVDPAWW